MKKTFLLFSLFFCIFSENNAFAQYPAVSKEVLADIIKSVPSPLEISFLIKDLGIKYDKTLTNSFNNVSKYNTNYKQALNLGIYSTDLGYCNIYEQTQDALGYLAAVKEMTAGLKMEQFLDFNTIKKLASNRSNLDSLLAVTTANFETINERLQEKGHADLAILILTGGWFESLYLTCIMVKKNPTEVLLSRIGDQKITVSQLLLLLSFYESNPNIKTLIEDMSELDNVYDKIKVSYRDAETNLIITDKDLDKIFNVVKKIRKKMIE